MMFAWETCEWHGCVCGGRITGVHVDTSVQHARQDAHAGLCVPALRQALLTSMAAPGSCPHTHGWTSVPLSAVLQDVRWQVQPSSTRPDTLGAQTVFVCALRQGVRAQELPVQARRVVVYACWDWNHDHRVPAETTPAPLRQPTTYYFRLYWSSIGPPRRLGVLETWVLVSRRLKTRFYKSWSWTSESWSWSWNPRVSASVLVLGWSGTQRHVQRAASIATKSLLSACHLCSCGTEPQ